MHGELLLHNGLEEDPDETGGRVRSEALEPRPASLADCLGDLWESHLAGHGVEVAREEAHEGHAHVRGPRLGEREGPQPHRWRIVYSALVVRPPVSRAHEEVRAITRLRRGSGEAWDQLPLINDVRRLTAHEGPLRRALKNGPDAVVIRGDDAAALGKGAPALARAVRSYQSHDCVLFKKVAKLGVDQPGSVAPWAQISVVLLVSLHKKIPLF